MAESDKAALYTGVFEGRVIGCTGSGPYSEAFIKDTTLRNLGIVGDKDIWQQDEVIVVGRSNYDQSYLEKSFEIGTTYDFQCRYLSQEDFLTLYQYGHDVAYSRDDLRIRNHAGLTFLATLGTNWLTSTVIPIRRVRWQVLPPGEHPFAQILNHLRQLPTSQGKVQPDEERLQFIYNLKPSNIYVGSDEFRRYIIFYFSRSRKAILECPYPDNAIYVINGDWEYLSRLSKADLIHFHESEMHRIIHKGNWQDELRKALGIQPVGRIVDFL
jgi:hypothetical protein